MSPIILEQSYNNGTIKVKVTHLIDLIIFLGLVLWRNEKLKVIACKIKLQIPWFFLQLSVTIDCYRIFIGIIL